VAILEFFMVAPHMPEGQEPAEKFLKYDIYIKNV